MSNAIELTAKQLAALDQIIEQKKKGNEFIFGAIVHAVGNAANDAIHAVGHVANDAINVVENVAPAVVAVTQIAAAVGAAMGLSPEKLADSSLKDIVKHMPVEKLMEVRKNAIVKKD